MSSFKKDELKAVLLNHGVKVNGTPKKDELIALYEKHVAPYEKGEFSSDEENDSPSKSSPRKKSASSASKSPARKASKSPAKGRKKSSEINVEDLNDEELFKELKSLGVDVGPIVTSTRKFYKKKLASLLRGETSLTNGLQNGEFSADDDTEDEQPAAKVVTRSPKSPKANKKKASQTKVESPTLRQRVSEATSNNTGGRVPTPRRSIHSYKVTETSKETLIRSPDGKVTRDFTYKKVTSEDNKVLGGIKNVFNSILRVLPYLILLLIVATVAYYVYTNYMDANLSATIEEAMKKLNPASPSSKSESPPVQNSPPREKTIPGAEDQPAVANV